MANYKRNSIESICIRKIETGIRSIKFGTKKREELELSSFFVRLQPLNPTMYDELVAKYKNVEVQELF